MSVVPTDGYRIAKRTIKIMDDLTEGVKVKIDFYDIVNQDYKRQMQLFAATTLRAFKIKNTGI